MSLIEVRNLSKFYRMGSTVVSALEDISFDVVSSEFVAITGRSGSGKSTLLNLLGCLDRASRGTIRLDGRVAGVQGDIPDVEVRRQLTGFVFQGFHLLNTMTALENVALALRYGNSSRAEARRKAALALESVDMTHRANHRPTELSGGEQQRVAIARAIVKRPRVLLADEPTGEVDSATAESILVLLERLNKEIPQTILVATHDEKVSRRAGRIISLCDGRLEVDQPVSGP